MSSEIGILQQHLSWNLTEEMQGICRIFFAKLKINYVDYARFYPDGRVVPLFTDKNYVSSFFEEIASGNSSNRVIAPGLHLWSEYINPNFLKEAAKKFKHAHGITIITQTNDYTEVFNLATTPDNVQIMSLYLNQQEVLQQMLAYVRKAAKKILHRLEDSPLIIPVSKSDTLNKELLLQEDVTKMLEIIQQEEAYSVEVNDIAIPVTKREAECLYYLIHGKTAKEIARILSISHRTVEVYFDQLRSKTISKNRFELLSKVNKTKLENLIIHP